MIIHNTFCASNRPTYKVMHWWFVMTWTVHLFTNFQRCPMFEQMVHNLHGKNQVSKSIFFHSMYVREIYFVIVVLFFPLPSSNIVVNLVFVYRGWWWRTCWSLRRWTNGHLIWSLGTCWYNKDPKYGCYWSQWRKRIPIQVEFFPFDISIIIWFFTMESWWRKSNTFYLLLITLSFKIYSWIQGKSSQFWRWRWAFGNWITNFGKESIPRTRQTWKTW